MGGGVFCIALARAARLWTTAVLVALCALLTSGCNEPEMPSLGLEPVGVYQGTWEYRYGDSPRRADGAFVYAQPDHRDEGWRPARTTWTPPGRHQSQYLWLRTRLVGGQLFDPVIFSRSTDYLYEVYLDGRLISGMGKIPPEKSPRIGGSSPFFVRLPADYAGRMLCIRLYSDYRTIGLMAPVRLGGRVELLVDLAKRDFHKPLVSLVLISFAVVGLITYVVRRREKAFLYFFGFSTSIGIFVGVSRNPSRYLISPKPHLWWAIELTSLCFIGLFLCGFFENVFGPGPGQLNRRFKNLFVLFFFGGTALVVAGVTPALMFLDYLQMMLLLAVLYLSTYCVVMAWLGNVDARIFGAGFFIAALPVIYDLLTALRLLRGEIDSPSFSALIIVSTLIILLSRRFLALNRRLLNFSAMLQLNLASASQLDDAQQAQVAITQVLKLLPVQRVTVFLVQPGEQRLTWVGSGTPAGPSTREPAEAEKSLVETVVARGRSVLGRAVGPDGETVEGQPKLLGMPLRAQGQLIGVLCVELRPGQDDLGGDDGELLAWLCNQLGLSVMTSRALRLEVAAAIDHRRLDEQRALLAAAARMAAGDLASPIKPVDSTELSSLAEALETMRRDLQEKFQTLQNYNRDIKELNEELRRQIDQRSRRVLELALQRKDQSAERQAHFAPGEQLGEAYSVVRLLGQGAMGSVYEVVRVPDKRHLAAKVLTPRADQITMMRFAREAQLLARLRHPNLISIVDIDVTASGVLFLVMELINGTTLKLCQDRYGDLRFALPVLRQIAAGLAAIHAAGIVHRDLTHPSRRITLLFHGKDTSAKAPGKPSSFLDQTETHCRMMGASVPNKALASHPRHVMVHSHTFSRLPELGGCTCPIQRRLRRVFLCPLMTRST